MHEHSLSWLGLWYHTRYTCDTFRLILHNFQFTMIKGYHINLSTTEEDRSWYFICLYLLSLDVGLIFFISGFLFLLRFKNCSHDSISSLNNLSSRHWHLSGIYVVDEKKFNNTDGQFQPTTAQKEDIDIVWWILTFCS
jgi:hypothetical protein